MISPRKLTMIGIIDYGMGNLRSVQKALERVGAEAAILRSPDDVTGLDKLILPGVGAFADGMDQLNQRGYVPAIHDFIATGRPFMGICLGMQLLFEGSEEDAPPDGPLVPGLAVLRGDVVRFHEDQGPDRPRLKVPHMGWNQLDWPGAPSPLFRGLQPGACVYFVHSYYCRPADVTLAAATADYGEPFCAAVHRDNVWATQFHPEKSQRVGLTILANFAAL